MKSFPTPVSMETFLQILTKAELVLGEMPADPEAVSGKTSPWFVKLMLGIAAWLSSLLFLAFIGAWLGSLFHEESVRAAMGLALCTLTAWHFSRNASSVFVDQVFFIVTLLGQALVLSAISGWFGFGSSYWTWLLTALFEITALVVINHRPHRFLSALAALFCLRQILIFHAAAGLFMPICLAAAAWTLNQQWRKPRFWPAVALALCSAPVLIAIFSRSFTGGWLYAGIDSTGFLLKIPFWASRLSTIGVWLGIVYTLLKQTTSAPFSPKNTGAWLLAILLAAGTWPMPLALFALAVLALGFSQRDRFLEGIGIAQLLWSVGYYYYALQDTLLFKSLSLFALGCLLLLLYAASHYLSPKEHGTEKKS